MDCRKKKWRRRLKVFSDVVARRYSCICNVRDEWYESMYNIKYRRRCLIFHFFQFKISILQVVHALFQLVKPRALSSVLIFRADKNEQKTYRCAEKLETGRK